MAFRAFAEDLRALSEFALSVECRWRSSSIGTRDFPGLPLLPRFIVSSYVCIQLLDYGVWANYSFIPRNIDFLRIPT